MIQKLQELAGPPKKPAIEAFQSNNSEASKAFHNKIYDEPHKTNSNRHRKYMEIILCNATSGIINSCIVVGALSGVTFFDSQRQSNNASDNTLLGDQGTICILVLVLGIATLVSNALTIAYSDYLKKLEYKKFYESEKRREVWECDNYIEGEQKEMIELYNAKGLSREDAVKVIHILSKNKKFFVDVMMKEELELMPPDEQIYPKLNSLIILVSYALFGIVPLLPYIFWYNYKLTPTFTFGCSMVVTTIALCTCGTLKSFFTVTQWYKSAVEMLLNGFLAFFSAVFISRETRSFFLSN